MIKGSPISDCTVCGHRFLSADPASPATLYGDGYFSGDPGGYVDYLRDGDRLRRRGNDYARLLARHMPPGRVLDIGAAGGFLLRGLHDLGWTGQGLEPNPAMAHHARACLGLDVRVGDLETFQPDGAFDLVMLVQVVPHFMRLRPALANALWATRPGGLWLVEAWDRNSMFAKACGRFWHEYNPPSIRHWFTPDSLAGLLRGYGLREVARGRPAKSISLAHGVAILADTLGLARTGAVLRRITGAVGGIPVPYPGDDVFWALYRLDDLPG